MAAQLTSANTKALLKQEKGAHALLSMGDEKKSNPKSGDLLHHKKSDWARDK